MGNYYTSTEIRRLGLASCGSNVLISRKTSIYGAKTITVGSNVRIDDFCLLSGKINIGNNVHIAAYSALYGGDKGIKIEDYVGISARTIIYSVSDDYTGNAMTNPTIPDKFKRIENKEVKLEKHVLIGAGCVVLPGVVLEEGGSFGAMTLINRSSEPWSINVGIPFRKIGSRSKELLKKEEDFIKEYLNTNE